MTKPVFFIDIGVNLTNSRFDKDRDQLIQAAIQAGVHYQVVTGTNAQESQAAFTLTQQYPQLFATAGCHPHDAARMNSVDLERIKTLLQQEKVVAVGECGLDFNRDFSPRDIQQHVFRQQIELACELKKPLFLHERDATDTMLAILDDYQQQLPNAVIHCFTGSEQALDAYLERGLWIGITGWICDERRGQELAQIVSRIPDDRLLIETDAPYLIPRDLKPKPKSNRNLPQYLPHIAKRIAELRQQSWKQIATMSSQNACNLFNLKLTPEAQP
ncbi:TatD family hydrolase [Kangiella sp. TOML190]|uniref:TatD family hydrolase n=1 Tax=Kangiella sp. TOML190 TaxID=2931351 RepID=UPI00203AE6FE|nr:TatD family hydrolase [Kangiella sp. TOML190]